MFRRPLSFFLALLFLSLPFLVHASTPSPDSGLICHTSNQEDCYPRIFEPTTSFQVVRDDQDLPGGLHVRLNLETGLKEAKLYDPSEDDDAHNAVHVSAGDSVQIVPGEGIVDESPSLPSAPQHPAKQPWKPLQNLYQKVLKSASGPNKPPVNGDGDGTAFTHAVEALQDAHPDPTHLDVLEDLTHDIYWGQTLAENAHAVQRLTRMVGAAEPALAGRAALILGNAARNNGGGLHAIAAYSFSGRASGQGSVYDTVLARLHLADASASGTPHGLPAAAYARLIYLLSSLLQDAPHRVAFLEAGRPLALAGAQHFGAAAAATSPDWHRPRAKIADLILDHFADPDRFPSVTACENPLPSPSVAAAENQPEVGAAELDAYAACRSKADAPLRGVLDAWGRELGAALEAWEGASGEGGPDESIVEHVREALAGVRAAVGELPVE